MPRYLYQAKAVNGSVTTGQIDASSEQDAQARLKSKQLTPLRLVKTGPAPAKASANVPLFSARVSSRDLQIFTRQFSTLINAGIPIVDSLRILGEGKRNSLLKETANKVRESIEGGKRLGDAMAQHTAVFDRFYVNMVRAGEEAGILDGILQRMALYLEKSEKLKKQIRGAMAYPVFVLVISIVIVIGILVFMFPFVLKSYTQSGAELPALTKMALVLSETITQRWYAVIMVLVGTPIGIVSYYRTPDGRDLMDRFFISMPLLGDLVQKASVARMTRTLSTLLSSGVSVVDALEIAAKTAGNKVIEEALLRSKDSVISGKPLAAPLVKEKMIPDMVTQMISIGEKSGTMDVMLSKIADFYEDDVENAVKALTSMIEPLLMVVLGAIIAVLLIAMYLPVFDMATTVVGK